MKVAALIHFYVPHRNAGSETMLHTMLKRLVQDEHEVTVFVTDIPEVDDPYVIDGVRVVPSNWVIALQNVEQFGPDVMISHHDNTMRTARLSRKLEIPWVFLVHNDMGHTMSQLSYGADLTVFNTRWIERGNLDKVPGKSIVIHPPVHRDAHKTNRGEAVTLVNLNKDKGAEIFYWLAQHMPDVKFLGVEGGHGAQVIREDLPNVEIVRHTDNMPRDVWSRTRILLMPSIYESYGMAGVEAMASGIPVIANPTPGLLESLGFGGIFVARDDGQGMVDAIDSLLDEDTYAHASGLADRRSLELDPTEELDEWAEAIRSLTNGSED